MRNEKGMLQESVDALFDNGRSITKVSIKSRMPAIDNKVLRVIYDDTRLYCPSLMCEALFAANIAALEALQQWLRQRVGYIHCEV